MKTVRYKRIGMKCFQCYVDEMEIEIKEGKVTLISGPNGVGKSTIFDAIPFTHYGVTSKGMRGSDVVNNRVGKDCHTWVEFYVDDDFYRQDTYYNHSRFGNTSILFKNNDLYKRGFEDVRKIIDALILPKKVFLNTILFSQKKTKSFFADLRDYEQKEILRSILSTNEFELYYDECKNRLDVIPDKLNNIQSKILVDEGVIESYEKRVEELKTKRADFEYKKAQDLCKLNENMRVLKNDINDFGSKISKIEPKRFGYENGLISINEKVLNVSSSIKEIENRIKTIKDELYDKARLKDLEFKSIIDKKTIEITNKSVIDEKAINDAFSSEKQNMDRSKNELSEQSSSMKVMIDVYNKDVKLIKSELDQIEYNCRNRGECPVCKRPIDDSTVDSLSEYMETLRNKLSNINSDKHKMMEDFKAVQCGVDIYNSELNKAVKEYKLKIDVHKDEVSAELNNLDTSYNETRDRLLNAMKDKLNDDSRMLADTLNKLKDSLIALNKERISIETDISNLNNLNNRLKLLESKQEGLQDHIDSVSANRFDESEIEEANHRILELRKEVEELLSNKDGVEEEGRILEFWKAGFSKSGIESMLMDECIPYLNERLLFYMDVISDGRYQVSFDTLKPLKSKEKEFQDKIYLRTLDTKTLSNSRDKFSSGQERLVDIGIILALGDLQSKQNNVMFNILLLDEVFDALSIENIRRVSRLLRLLSETRCVCIISHLGEFSNEMDIDEELKLYD